MTASLNDTSSDLVYALINAANLNLPNGPLTATNSTLGTPAASGTTPNTTVTLTAVAGEGYTGEVTISYGRIDIGAMFTTWGDSPVLVPSGANYTTVAELIAYLNSTYTLDLQDSDVVTGSIPAGPYPYSYTLTMNSASLAYIGTLPITLQA